MKKIFILLIFTSLIITAHAQTFFLGKSLKYIQSYFLGHDDIESTDYPYSIEYRFWNTSSGSYTFSIDKKDNKCYHFVYWPNGGISGRNQYIQDLNEQLGLSKEGSWYLKHPDDGRRVEIYYSVQMGLGGQFDFTYK